MSSENSISFFCLVPFSSNHILMLFLEHFPPFSYIFFSEFVLATKNGRQRPVGQSWQEKKIGKKKDRRFFFLRKKKKFGFFPN